MAVDGRETWNIQNFSYPGEVDLTCVDRDWAIRMILGVGPDFHYEVLSKEDWIARRLVADKFQNRRVFICGDAAHLWIPLGGYGMNAGIADAANLSWKLAGTLNGWASPAILDAYDTERQPITDQVSRIIADVAHRVIKKRSEISADIERQDSVGKTTRGRVGEEAYDLDVQQQCCGGLNFGYYYKGSPIIVYDGESAPAYTMGNFKSSTVPGCRVPHVWLEGHRSLYDALGPDYTLLRLDLTTRVTSIIEAAAERSVPLIVVDVKTPEASELYSHKLVLVRPDQHVAWRGDKEPADPLELIDIVRGACAVRKSTMM
jgi:hypothetical protein